MKKIVLFGTNQRISSLQGDLKARGFDVLIESDFKATVRRVIEEKPQYALIKASQISPRSHWLLRVLSQVTHLIFYTERITATTLLFSQEFKGTELLEPPLTNLCLIQSVLRAERQQERSAKKIQNLEDIHLKIMSALSGLALKTVCRPFEQGSAGTLSSSSQLLCFRLWGYKISGYFMLRFSESRPLDAPFIAHLQREIAGLMGSFTEPGGFDETIELQISPAIMPKWLQTKADFICSQVHERQELTLAFFKDPQDLRISPSKMEHYHEVAINDVPTETILNFDVYIYLPQNSKFILYTPCGGTLFDSQKQHLKDEGVTSVHIANHSLRELRRLRAQSFIEKSVGNPEAP